MKWLDALSRWIERRADPRPGEDWHFCKPKQGPWPSEQLGQSVRVLDVAEGWVRFDMAVFRDQRMRVDTFKCCYRRANDPAWRKA
jgi:hypothetical protein